MCERQKKIFLLNEVLYGKQYGFRKNSIAIPAVNHIVDDLIEDGEKKKYCSLFLDLAKAFNTVCHVILVF